MTVTTAPSSAVDAVRALAPQMRAALDEMDRERRLPVSLASAMLDAGLFHVWAPASIGGAEAEPASLVRAIEVAAAIDGSIGWNLMISGVFGVFGGCLPEAAAREIYGVDPRVITAGTFRPNGKAVPVDGGYSITGRWPFASNCQNATWLVGGALIMDSDRPRLSESGLPIFREFFFPASDCLIVDTWQSAGLRGTGSHDFTASDVFVPAARSLSFSEPAIEPGPLYALPLIALFATAIAAVSLGIARHAISILQELSGAKKPTWSTNLLRERSSVQWQVGQGEALVRAGRAFLYEALDDAWQTVRTGRWITLEQRTLLWLASTQAAQMATQAVDLMWSAGGATSVYASTGLERCLRDVRTASQHVCVIPHNYELGGQVFLGLDASTSLLAIDGRGDG